MPAQISFFGMNPQASATTSDSWDRYFKCCISLDHLYLNIYVASFSDSAIFCGVFQDWQQGIMREFAFGPDPGLLLILLKAPRRYAPEHFAFLTQVAADANGGVKRRVSTGIVVGNMGEHGVKYHEVPWLLPWGLGAFLKAASMEKGRI